MKLPWKTLSPRSLWRHFAALSAIPRTSTKKAAARNYVLAQAARLGLDPIRGGVGNVVIRNPLCTSYDSLVRLARQDSSPKWSLWEGGKLQ
jgi:di/tripeptidase